MPFGATCQIDQPLGPQLTSMLPCLSTAIDPQPPTGPFRGPEVTTARTVLSFPALVSRSSSYRRHVTLEESELARLDGAIRGRPTMIECWSVCAGRQSVADALVRVQEVGNRAQRLAAQARRELR